MLGLSLRVEKASEGSTKSAWMRLSVRSHDWILTDLTVEVPAPPMMREAMTKVEGGPR